MSPKKLSLPSRPWSNDLLKNEDQESVDIPNILPTIDPTDQNPDRSQFQATMQNFIKLNNDKTQTQVPAAADLSIRSRESAENLRLVDQEIKEYDDE